MVLSGKRHRLICLIAAAVLLTGISTVYGDKADKIKEFLFPSYKNSAGATYILNGEIDNEEIKDRIALLSDTGMWRGYAFIPQISTEPAPDTAEYDNMFGNVFEIAQLLENKVTLYEDMNYINANTRNLVENAYPQAKAEYLFIDEYILEDGETFTYTVPDGHLMAAVGMNTKTKDLDDLSDRIDNGTITVLAPNGAGDWRIMFFMCRTQEISSSINFLSEDASMKYIELIYGKYVNKTIDKIYFANINMTTLDGGLPWTHDFNEKYEKKYGKSPALLYPALVYDIGEYTASAKVSLYSFRTELFSEGFPKAMQTFSNKNNLLSAGSASAYYGGDYIKFYKNIDIPVLDSLSSQGISGKLSKLISSASYNYDKRITAATLFEKYEALSKDTLYKTVMNAYVKGINSVYLNAVYHTSDKTVNNDLSYKTNLAPYIPELNSYISRLNVFLQEGDTVADIAVIYPIETLHASYSNDRISREDVPYADYLDVGEWLHQYIRTDFMYLHPDYIAENGFEKYAAVVLPGCEVISIKTLKKLKDYYKNGGKIIGTYLLPSKSAEAGYDNEVKETITYIFGNDAYQSSVKGRVYENANNKGGKAFFVHSYAYGTPEYFKNIDLIKLAVDESIKIRDVSFGDVDSKLNGNLSYIHKKTDDGNLYYIANTGTESYNGTITLKGLFKPCILNPHTGEVSIPEYRSYKVNGQNVTGIKLNVSSLKSVLIYCGAKVSDITVPLLFKGDISALNNSGIFLDDGSVSFVFSLSKEGGIKLSAREGYTIEIENGNINLYRNKELIDGCEVHIENDLYYTFTLSMEKNIFSVYLSGRCLLETRVDSFANGRISIDNTGKAELGDIIVLGNVEEVNTVEATYTFYLVIMMTIVILRFTKLNHNTLLYHAKKIKTE